MNTNNFEPCRRILGYLDSYLNNELLVETNHEVLRHLEKCANCSAELESRERIRTLLRNAVREDKAPASLQERIKSDIRRTRSHSGYGRNWTSWPVAATLLVAALAAWGIFRLLNPAPSDLALPRAGIDMPVAEQAAGVLRIGLGDHLHCAIDYGFAKRQFTPEEMAQKMGPDFIGLVSLAKARMPGDWEVAVAHRCSTGGRQFVHLILKNHERVLSLAITKKNGDSLPAAAPVHQMRIADYETAGFETKDYLAFVVSDLAETENYRVASRLAPAVSDFLAKLEG